MHICPLNGDHMPGLDCLSDGQVLLKNILFSCSLIILNISIRRQDNILKICTKNYSETTVDPQHFGSTWTEILSVSKFPLVKCVLTDSAHSLRHRGPGRPSQLWQDVGSPLSAGLRSGSLEAAAPENFSIHQRKVGGAGHLWEQRKLRDEAGDFEGGGFQTEMEKRVDIVDISVLIFSYSCANFLAVYAQTNYKHCAV